ncbi:MAG: fused MFS/spermidine synthase [Coriobacteriales bacterium]|nr:fused MFS/spermidine synthase [Coriobacteriales bacterium]
MGLLQDLLRWLGRRTIARADSRFGSIRIFEETRDHDRIRVLAVDGTYQSATYLDERWNRAPFEYLQRFFVIFELGLPMRHVCMLGGGGYAFPKELIAYHPGVRISVVEIDPVVTRLAREHFFLDRCMQTYRTNETGMLELVEADAIEYLRRCERQHCHFDAIINDCFAAETATQAFATDEAIRLVNACLSPQGVYLINVIASFDGGPSDNLMRLTSALSGEFGHIYALPCSHERDDEPYNMVIVAAHNRLSLQAALVLFESAGQP